MLIEIINTCTSSINELSTLHSNDLSLRAYETSVNKLTEVDALVTDFVATVEEMNKHDFCKVNFSEEEMAEMRESVITCAKAVNSKSLSNNDVAVIRTVFEAQKKKLTFFWKSAATEYVNPIRNYLGIIQTFATNKEEISNLIKALNSGSKAEPSAAIVRTLVANAQKANLITSNFQMSEGVCAFLQKARNCNATYADITDDVSKWIKEYNLGSRIKLTF